MRRAIYISLFISTLSTFVLSAQTDGLTQLNPISPVPGGFRLQNVSMFAGYDSLGMEGLLTSEYNPSGITTVGISATLGFSRSGERTDFSIIYTPSYTRFIGNLGADTSTHALSMNWRRSLSPKWSYNVSLVGNLTMLNESLVSSAAPAENQGSPTQAAPAGDSTVSTLFYGQRFLTAVIQNSLSYAYSPRLNFRFGVSGSRMQSLPKSGAFQGSQYGSLLSRTNTGSASMGLAYSLSPRTQVGIDAGSSRMFSSIQDSYVTSLNVSLAHSTGLHWFTQIHGGTGFISPVGQTYQVRGLQYQAGASVGYKTYAHSFTVSADRSASDSYGLGATATLSTNASWTWNRPGRSWWLTSTFERQVLIATAFGSIDTWHVSTGFGRLLGRRMATVIQYVYGSYTGAGAGPLSQMSQQVVRLSFSWTPTAGMPH